MGTNAGTIVAGADATLTRGRCARCGGTFYRDEDGIACWNCGRPAPAPEPAARKTFVPPPPPPRPRRRRAKAAPAPLLDGKCGRFRRRTPEEIRDALREFPIAKSEQACSCLSGENAWPFAELPNAPRPARKCSGCGRVWVRRHNFRGGDAGACASSGVYELLPQRRYAEYGV